MPAQVYGRSSRLINIRALRSFKISVDNCVSPPTRQRFLFSLAPFPSSEIPAPPLPLLCHPLRGFRVLVFPGSGRRERVSAWERSGSCGHARWGRRTAHAGRWRARRPESLGSPCFPPVYVVVSEIVGQWRVRSRAGLGSGASEQAAGSVRARPPEHGALGAAPGRSGRRRESSRGARRGTAGWAA